MQQLTLAFRGGCSRRLRALTAALAVALVCASPAAARVLRVGSYHGNAGDFSSIQQAVDAAQPGDWILIGPGDYHETGNRVAPGAQGDDRAGTAVLDTTPGLHIRGMDRNGVVLDGTKPGAPQCSGAESDQDLGVPDAAGNPSGRNGLIVFKASGTSVENLTACNFLTGDVAGGNQIWFDGGGATGKQALGSWRGAYLSATSSYFKDNASPFANYGIYVSNTYGPGVFTQVYANDQADSAYYIGACPDCNTILDHAHAEHSALGYSGTNSGGRLIVQNSEFDDNQSGFVTNSQNNDDAPEPQIGSCPSGMTGPTGSGSCWVFRDNSVHDNNDPNVPANGGAAGAGPVGSGVVIAGGRFDTVTHNHVFNNGAWGIILVPYPDTESPPDIAQCRGGTGGSFNGQAVCYFDDFGSEVFANSLDNNGFFGNPSNGDLAELSNPENPGNCWHDNTGAGGGAPSSDPPNLQSPPHSQCGVPDAGDPLASPLGAEVACDSQLLGPCPLTAPVANYPRADPAKAKTVPLPAQPSMPDPCLAVPRNPWCPNNAVNPAPYPVPGAPYTADMFGGSAALGLPSAHRCASRRDFVIHLGRASGVRLRSARVYVDGKRVRVLTGRRLRARIDLRRLPAGAVTVKIVAHTRSGRTIVGKRRYHTCTRRRKRARR